MSEMDLTPRTDGADPGAAPAKKKRNLLPMVVLALVLVAGGVIVTQFLNSAVDYFCNVDEVGVRDGCEEERRIRLQGTVDAGSIDESTPGVTAFTMTFGGESIDVRYTGGGGEPGGIFQECIPVVVHGEIRNGVLDGDRIEVRHSDEYEAENASNLDDADDYAETECTSTDA